MYRELDRPEEAEALFIATLNTARRVLDNEHYTTLTTIERLAARDTSRLPTVRVDSREQWERPADGRNLDRRALFRLGQA